MDTPVGTRVYDAEYGTTSTVTDTAPDPCSVCGEDGPTLELTDYTDVGKSWSYWCQACVSAHTVPVRA
jgi:hypothetical protein